MSKQLENRSERERPEHPETPFLCASCRFGVLLVQKVFLHDRFERKEQPWEQNREAFVWNWEARCNNPRVAGRWPETFDAPVVDCEGFEVRRLGVVTEDPHASADPGSA